MLGREFKPGDLVVYRKTKHSTSPGPRAKQVVPARYGDDYTYQVDKFWVVAESRSDSTLLLQTRRGKTHLVDSNNPNLRRAHWWERWLYGDRFPRLSSPNHPPAAA